MRMDEDENESGNDDEQKLLYSFGGAHGKSSGTILSAIEVQGSPMT